LLTDRLAVSARPPAATRSSPVALILLAVSALAPASAAPLTRDPQQTLDVRDCVCDAADCALPCGRYDGVPCIRIYDAQQCGMQLPCCVAEPALTEVRARRAARVPAPPAPAQPACVVAEHPPRLAPFEVTVREYAHCVDAGVCTPPVEFRPRRVSTSRDGEQPGPRIARPRGAPPFRWRAHPANAVAPVDFEQADAYCSFIGSRLPTDEEWLAAARADCHPFPWGDHPSTRRSSCVDVDHPRREIGPPGRHREDVVRGVHDLHGNVAEWTAARIPRGAPACMLELGAPAETEGPRLGIRCMVKEGTGPASR